MLVRRPGAATAAELPGRSQPPGLRTNIVNLSLFALLPPGRYPAPKVSVFIDFLIERLGSVPWRSGARLEP
jgi:hypothetical protein